MHNHSHSEQHSHSTRRNRCCSKGLTKTQSILFMLTLTISLFFVELIVGHMTKSNALVADSFHMLSDVISLVIGLVAVRMSKRTSIRNTYGWVRAEVLGSLVNSVFLLALCFSIIIEAINRFIKPEVLEKVDLMLIVGAVGLGINLIGLVIFGSHGHTHSHNHAHGHSHSHEDHHEHESHDLQITVVENVPPETHHHHNEDEKEQKKVKSTRNMNMHGVFLHVLSDALGSIAVIISGLVVKYAPPTNDATATWKLYIDPILSILITILISFSTFPLLKETSLVLMQTVPRLKNVKNVEELKESIRKIHGIEDVHHFHLWSLNPDKLIASAHLKIARQSKYEEFSLMQNVKRLLHKNDIHATTLQLEYDEYSINDETRSNQYDLCDGLDCSRKQCCAENASDQVKLIENEEQKY